MTRSSLSSVLRLVLISAPLVLAACSSTPMPTGYTYEHEVYKSPPGPEGTPPAKILKTGQDASALSDSSASGSSMASGAKGADGSYTATATMGADGTWNRAADDLVAMILRDLGRPMEKVYVPGDDAFVASLKGSLASHDIPVAANPGDGPFVIEHTIESSKVTIHFFSNHEKILSETGNHPDAR